MADLIDHPDTDIAQQRDFRELQRAAAPRNVQAAVLRAIYSADLSGLVDRLSMPTLLLHGRGDPLIPFAPAACAVTILFTDVEGSTALTERLGDAGARDLLREHERIVREALKAHGGSEVKTMGDGFMASFGSAVKALECAVAIQRAFAARNASLPAHPEPAEGRVEGRAEPEPLAHPFGSA